MTSECSNCGADIPSIELSQHIEQCCFRRRSTVPPPTPESESHTLRLLERDLETHISTLTLDGLFKLTDVLKSVGMMTETEIERRMGSSPAGACSSGSKTMPRSTKARADPEESDMQIARRLQMEEEREIAMKKQEEEQSFQEFLRMNAQCHVCLDIIIENGDDTNVVHAVASCDHRVCRSCMLKFVSSSKPSKKSEYVCPVYGCGRPLGPGDAQALLPPEAHDHYLELGLSELVDGNTLFMRCPHCNSPIEKFASEAAAAQEGSRSRSKSITESSAMSAEALEHKRIHRFRCGQCNTEFCAGCKQIPYHAGYTCENYQLYTASVRCRFCDKTVEKQIEKKSGKKKSVEVPPDLCGAVECQTKFHSACKLFAPCSHPCNGIAAESNCLGCLKKSCRPAGTDTFDVDFCNICWTEDLGHGPCLQLECGHIFHFACILQKLASKWPGARISFTFMECSLCKRWMNHPAIKSQFSAAKTFLDLVNQRAMARLKAEPAIPDELRPGGRFFGEELKYAMARYAFYDCAKCHQPYFGGLRRCDVNDEEVREFNRNELICGSCSATGTAKCPTHGTAYIEYKCRFCCAIASWFCWGTTHFCDECHRKQGTADSMSKKARTDLPRCPGGKACPSGGDHPASGEEFVLGCALCRR